MTLVLAAIASVFLAAFQPMQADAASPPAAPSSEAIAACRAKLHPFGRRHPYADIFERFEQDICEGAPAGDSRWQACILGKLQSGAVAPRNIHEAYNACMPGVSDCNSEMNRYTGAATWDVRRFGKEFCQFYPDSTDAEHKCIASLARRGTFFLGHPKTTHLLCFDATQECVRDFLPDGVRGQSTELIGAVASMCGVTRDEMQREDRACIKAHFTAGRYLKTPVTARYLCKEENRPVQDCIRGHLESGIFKKAKRGYGGSIFDEIEMGNRLCRISDDRARGCVMEQLEEGFNLGEALHVCTFGSSDTRACIRDFLSGAEPYAAAEWADVRRRLSLDLDNEGRSGWHPSSASTASEICRVSNLGDRRCIAGSFLDWQAKGRDGRDSISLAHWGCRDSSEERKECIAAAEASIGRLVRMANELTASAKRIDLYAVCGITNFEIRSCVISKLPEMLRSSLRQEVVVSACSAGFVNYLSRPLDGVGPGMDCSGFRR